MTKLIRCVIAITAIAVAGTAHAYRLVEVGSDRIDVYCDGTNGAFVGSMFWNGSKWSDGLRADIDKDVVAKQMVAAQGSSCR